MISKSHQNENHRLTVRPNQPQLAQGGTYGLILQLEQPAAITIGRLGQFHFPAGHYLYLGSAYGPGGLAARLRRHLSADPAKPRHWHIDYLRPFGTPIEIWYTVQATPREHDWAGLAAQLPGAAVPAPRFGASDCRCPSHLFHFARRPTLAQFRRLVGAALPADSVIHSIRPEPTDSISR
jgi:Uri superfamily endonuclease